MQNHALAKDDELRPVFIDQFQRGRHIDLVRVVNQHGEVCHSRALCARVVGDVVLQRTHRLGAQVTPLPNMVGDCTANSPRLCLAVSPIDIVHHRTENGRVSHLAADEAYLHILAAEEFLHFLFKHPFNLADEFRALVVENFGIVECLGPLVFSISKGRIHHRKESDHGRNCHLRRNKVDALSLSPNCVLHGLFQQSSDLARCIAGWEFFSR